MIDQRHLDKWNCIEKIGDWEYCILKQDYTYKNDMTCIYSKEPTFMTKEIFDTCPFKDKIFKNYDVEMVVLGGSGLYHATDDISDYDIDVYIPTAQIQNLPETECLFYKNRKFHWYYQSIENLFTSTFLGDAFLSVELHFLQPSNFLYLKENTLLADKLLSLKESISEIGMQKLANRYQSILQAAYNNTLTKLDLNTKSLGILALCYYIITKTEVDKTIVTLLKRCPYNIIEDSDFNKVKNIFCFLYNYFNK